MASHNSDRTGLMGIYDANDTTIMVDGHEMFGFQDGDMFTATYDQDRWATAQDAQGTGTASKNNKTGGTITINLIETSPCNAIMEKLLKLVTSLLILFLQLTTCQQFTATYKRSQTFKVEQLLPTVAGRSRLSTWTKLHCLITTTKDKAI